MTMVRVTCEHCSFSRGVPAEKIPDRPIRVTCPKCAQTFQFHKTPAAGPAAPPASVVPPAPAEKMAVPAPAAPVLQRPIPRPERETPPSPPRPPRRAIADTAVPPSPKPAPLALLILLLLAVAGAAWWLNFPAVSAVPDGSHQDPKNAFALKAPPEWILITPENYSTIVNQFRDRIPGELSRFIGKGKPGFAVSFIRIPSSETEFAANLNLAVIDTKGKNLPPLTESEKAKAVETFSAQFSKVLPSYRLLGSRIVAVDGVDSLEVTGETELSVVTKPSTPIYEPGAFGLRRVTGHTEAETQTYKIRAIQTLIPGKKRAYVLSFMYDELKAPDMGKLHADVVETFRLLERPPRFGMIVMGGLNGALFGAGLYLFGIVIGRLFRSGE